MLLELSYLYPEIWLLSMTCVILLIDLFRLRMGKRWSYVLCQITLVGILYFSGRMIGQSPQTLFYNMFVMDDLANILKVAIGLMGFFVFWYSRQYVFKGLVYRSEYFILCLFSMLGMMVLVSARSFLTIYLGIELLALPLYALITIVKEDAVAPEAAMKYFVMGALASGLLLYGISLVYGLTGSFELLAVAAHFSANAQAVPNVALLFGLVFIIVGLAFKFGAVPFHMWLPDVYQGAPLSVTLFIGTLPKLAAFGFAIRLLVDTFSALAIHWQPLFVILSVLSLIVGNLGAIAQSNLKRMLGYSTIAHMGFLFLGLLAGPQSGFAAALNYVLIYVLMALGVFGLMTVLSHRDFEAENLEDFRGLGVRQPWLAVLMMGLMFSLMGLPPFAGFYAKLFVLEAVMHAGYTWVAVLAVLMTVIGAFYYLRVVRLMFFDVPQGIDPYQAIAKTNLSALSLNGFLVLALGIFPAPLFTLCSMVMAVPK